jgi:hypothetical protein
METQARQGRATHTERFEAQVKKGRKQRRDCDNYDDSQHSDWPNVIQIVCFDLPKDNCNVQKVKKR